MYLSVTVKGKSNQLKCSFAHMSRNIVCITDSLIAYAWNNSMAQWHFAPKPKKSHNAISIWLTKPTTIKSTKHSTSLTVYNYGPYSTVELKNKTSTRHTINRLLFTLRNQHKTNFHGMWNIKWRTVVCGSGALFLTASHQLLKHM